MRKLSQTEENYLKVIYKHTTDTPQVGTNALSAALKTTPASVTDMLKRLSERGYLEYQPYYGVSLTDLGRLTALLVIRRHRLWEVFLVKVLGFSWDQVHDAAEQLEHIDDEMLIERLDGFLGYPKYDPHGDPIPDINGVIKRSDTILLSQAAIDQEVEIFAVLQHDSDFLKYLSRLHLTIGMKVKITEIIPFDNSRLIKIGDQHEMIVSSAVTEFVLVAPVKELA